MTSGGSSAATQRDEPGASPFGREWQWQANPRPEWFSPTREKGRWTLACIAVPSSQTLWHAGHVLLRKLIGPAFSLTITLQLRAIADGDRCGLVVFGHDYAWIGLSREHGVVRLVLRVCAGANCGGDERTDEEATFGESSVRVRVLVDEATLCRFSFSRDGERFESFGAAFQAKSSTWVGAKVGVFAAAAPLPSDGQRGRAEISEVDVQVLETPTFFSASSP